jgi:hypothetical protein
MSSFHRGGGEKQKVRAKNVAAKSSRSGNMRMVGRVCRMCEMDDVGGAGGGLDVEMDGCTCFTVFK